MNILQEMPVRTNVTPERGALSVLELFEFPFEVKRVFWITELPHRGERGGHAHHAGHQLLFAMTGQVRIHATGPGLIKSHKVLNSAKVGLWVPPMHWLDIRIWGAHTSLLVFASNAYAECDYIRDWATFKRLAQK